MLLQLHLRLLQLTLIPKCIDCNKLAEWLRKTQFAGTHPFCQEHAEKEPDFKKSDSSYFFWEKINYDEYPANR